MGFVKDEFASDTEEVRPRVLSRAEVGLPTGTREASNEADGAVARRAGTIAGKTATANPDPMQGQRVRQIRLSRMLSKAELARRANVSVLTVDRIERGYGCRMATKRKILEALGLSLVDGPRVFGTLDG